MAIPFVGTTLCWLVDDWKACQSLLLYFIFADTYPVRYMMHRNGSAVLAIAKDSSERVLSMAPKYILGSVMRECKVCKYVVGDPFHFSSDKSK